MNTSLTLFPNVFCNDILTLRYCRPVCSHCNSKGYHCDYSIKLTWGGKPVKSHRDSIGSDITIQFDQPMISPPGILPHSMITYVLAGSYCSGQSPPEVLSPDHLRSFTNQPSDMPEPTDFNTPPFRRPSFDCSIQQLLSPKPYTRELPMVTNSVDATIPAQPLFPTTSNDVKVSVKTEDIEDSLGEPVQDMILNRQSALVMANPEPQYINPQLTFANFTTIPQSLTMVTSPLLEKNPAFRHLYQHFIRHTCRVLVPHDDQHNPFRTILAQMALHPSAQHLLAALLASSAAHRAGMKGEAPPKYLISNLLQTTLRRPSKSPR